MSLDYLAKKNAHPRDAFIQFEESTHVYTVHGDSSYTSVTTWNHHHFAKFDADKIIKQILSSRKHRDDPEYKYYMMTAGQIMDMWNANRDSAATSGTNMHYDIECFQPWHSARHANGATADGRGAGCVLSGSLAFAAIWEVQLLANAGSRDDQSPQGSRTN